MFLIRAAFWLTLVIAFIPVHPEDLKEGQRAVSTGETIGAAQAVIADLAGFCERNGHACDTGRELFSQLSAKAATGARQLLDYLDEENGAPAPETDLLATGSLEPGDPRPTAD